jgi:hypothetical protein
VVIEVELIDGEFFGELGFFKVQGQCGFAAGIRAPGQKGGQRFSRPTSFSQAISIT